MRAKARHGPVRRLGDQATMQNRANATTAMPIISCSRWVMLAPIAIAIYPKA